jgi:hypothetical protein
MGVLLVGDQKLLNREDLPCAARSRRKNADALLRQDGN